MNTALRSSPILMVLALASTSILPRGEAAGQAAPSTDSFTALRAECGAATKRWSEEHKTAYEAAKKQGEAAAKAFRFDKPWPCQRVFPRFLAIAEKNPEGPEALDAIKMALLTSYGPKGKQTRCRGHQNPRRPLCDEPQDPGSDQGACPVAAKMTQTRSSTT